MSEICPYCKNIIDSEVCWCGDYITGYHDNHNPVPMGCTCGFVIHQENSAKSDNES